MNRRVLLGVFLALAAAPALALIQPLRINFQGKLIDPSTNNPRTGSATLTFNLYNVPTGGTSLFSETQSVSLTNGVFSVEIGTISTLSRELFLGASVYLGVTVSGDAGGEMLPRQNLVMSAYAFTANQLSDLNEVRLIAGPTYSTFTAAGNFAVPAGISGSSGTFTNGITASTGTFLDNAFSVGGSSFTVVGGSATVAYLLTASNVSLNAGVPTATLDVDNSAAFATAVEISSNNHVAMMSVDSMGRLGITGTAPPSAALDVRRIPADDYALKISSNDGTAMFTVGETAAITAVGTTTILGSAFSVGGSSFTVVGGSATVAYSMTANSFAGNLTGGINIRVTAGGTVNAITLNPTPPLTSYASSVGMKYVFAATGNNTVSPPTVNISGLGALNTTMGSVAVPVGGLIGGNNYFALLESPTSIRLTPYDALSSNGDTVNGVLTFVTNNGGISMSSSTFGSSTAGDGTAMVIWLKNASGGVVNAGAIVVAASPFSFTTVAVAQTLTAIGVAFGPNNCANGAICPIAISGVVNVTTAGIVTAGQCVTTSATAGSATSVGCGNASNIGSAIGRWLQTTAGAGTAAARLW